MTGKQSLVGWLGLFLIVVNVLEGGLSDLRGVLTTGGTHGSKGRPPDWLPGLPKFPDLPGPIPQGPVTGLPLSPIHYTTPRDSHAGAVTGVLV